MANTEYPWRYRLRNGEPELVPETEPNWRSIAETRLEEINELKRKLNRYEVSPIVSDNLRVQTGEV